MVYKVWREMHIDSFPGSRRKIQHNPSLPTSVSLAIGLSRQAPAAKTRCSDREHMHSSPSGLPRAVRL